MSLLCFIFLSPFTSILCVLETGFEACVFIYVSFFLSVTFIILLLFSAVTAVIAVSTHLLRLYQLRLRIHLLRPHLLRLWLQGYGYGYIPRLLLLRDSSTSSCRGSSCCGFSTCSCRVSSFCGYICYGYTCSGCSCPCPGRGSTCYGAPYSGCGSSCRGLLLLLRLHQRCTRRSGYLSNFNFLPV